MRAGRECVCAIRCPGRLRPHTAADGASARHHRGAVAGDRRSSAGARRSRERKRPGVGRRGQRAACRRRRRAPLAVADLVPFVDADRPTQRCRADPHDRGTRARVRRSGQPHAAHVRRRFDRRHGRAGRRRPPHAAHAVERDGFWRRRARGWRGRRRRYRSLHGGSVRGVVERLRSTATDRDGRRPGRSRRHRSRYGRNASRRRRRARWRDSACLDGGRRSDDPYRAHRKARSTRGCPAVAHCRSTRVGRNPGRRRGRRRRKSSRDARVVFAGRELHDEARAGARREHGDGPCASRRWRRAGRRGSAGRRTRRLPKCLGRRRRRRTRGGDANRRCADRARAVRSGGRVPRPLDR